MFRARQYWVFFFLISLLLSLLFRLSYLQIINFDKFSRLASEQHNRVFKIEPRRGNIYDRFAEPLAINLDAQSIYCNPKEILDKESAAGTLSEILHIDRERLLEKFARDKMFVWIMRKIDASAAERIKKEGLTGIYFASESKRNYPNDSMASHIIGFVDIDNKGLEGLEMLFDKKLKGKPGWKYLLRDAKKADVLLNGKESISPQAGYNLVLTIDSVIQYMAEEELKNMAERFHASSASAIVTDPVSGKILALANYPDYDLNSSSKASQKFMKNIAIANIYEPGSVFKIVTASAALNEGIISLEELVYCENGRYKVGGRTLHDFHKYGELSFREVIAKSSNIGTVKVAERLGEKKVYEYIKKFGFGEKTGIDSPGEVKGITRTPEAWSKSDISTIPMGQGIAVTPIQLACAINVIANGGYLMKPYVVDKITTWEGEIYERFEPVLKNKVLSEETCQKLIDVLRHAITSGTGRRARSKLYDMCGKTGTAQMVNPSGGYYANKYDATFVGFAPAESPLISIVIAAHDPHPVHFGGSVAGPTFKRIAERVLQYLGSERE